MTADYLRELDIVIGDEVCQNLIYMSDLADSKLLAIYF